MKNEWLLYVALAGLSWGTYVPLIAYGGSELGGKAGDRLMAILCVGVAYFAIAVVFPMFMFLSQREKWPDITTTGLVFSGMAGVAGAVGALCVIFASKSAASPDARLYIAPLIFGLAPIINTLVSTLWHPEPGNPFHFKAELPGWKLWVGILLVGIGAALVLFSKEEAHKKSAARPQPAAVAVAPAGENPPPWLSKRGAAAMSPGEAVERLNVVLAHAWMVRTFLKHADEVQEDEEMLEVPRTLFDSIRALEPSREQGDFKEYLRRLRGKLPKLRRVAEFFAAEYRRASDHTNFQMAALSLSGCVKEIEEVLAAIGENAGETKP